MKNHNVDVTTMFLDWQKGKYDNSDYLIADCKRRLQYIANQKNYTFDSNWDFDDYCNDVFTRLFEKCANYDENKGNFTTWFNKLADNVYNKHCEKEKRRVKTICMYQDCDEEDKEYNLIDFSKSVKSCENAFLEKESIEGIMHEIETLPNNYRKAVCLCRLDGLKPSYVADIMGCKADDISRWIHRGVKKIEQYIELEMAS